MNDRNGRGGALRAEAFGRPSPQHHLTTTPLPRRLWSAGARQPSLGGVLVAEGGSACSLPLNPCLLESDARLLPCRSYGVVPRRPDPRWACPQGCVVTHGSLSHYAAAKAKVHGLGGGSTAFVASSHTFDPSLGDFVSAW